MSPFIPFAVILASLVLCLAPLWFPWARARLSKPEAAAVEVARSLREEAMSGPTREEQHAEIIRLRALVVRSIPALEQVWSFTRGGPAKSEALRNLQEARAVRDQS